MNKRKIINWNTLRKIIMTVCIMNCTLLSFAQGGVPLTGTVTDANGEPLIGVNIFVKGTTIGVISDVNGKYSINAPNRESVLVFSFVGFATQEITVANKTSINVALNEDAKEIEEVVVVGYGSQRKVTLTGAVAAISNEEIITTKTGNIQNALSGKIAGVKNYQRTSEPGTFNNDFSIRGMGSPLIVVDGVPRDNFTRLDANEIESISVLKDASASIYGVRAANGVILVTTKKGLRNAKFQLDYTGYYGIQRTLKPERPLNALEYMELRNERSLNLGGTSMMYPRESFEPYWNGTAKTTDWTSEINENVPQAYHNISATGGTEKLDYFVSLGYNDEDGIWKSGDLNYQRYNLRSNITAHITKGLKAEVLLNLMTDTKNQPSNWDSANLIKGMYTQVPLNPYYANDNPLYPYNAADGLHPEMTTYAEYSGYQKRHQRLAQTNLSLEWELPWVKGLKAKGMYSYDYTENENKIFRKQFNLYEYNPNTEVYNTVTVQSPSFVQRAYYGHINSLFQLSLSYAGKFNEVHNVSALALYEETEREGDNFWGQRDLSLDALDQLFAGNSTNQQSNMNTGIGDLYHFVYKALVGRVNYDYASKYLGEFSFRYDASSKNAPGHRWGFFPSGFVGWRLSEEAFIKDNESLRFINNLKIRASYGLMGDDSSTNSYQFVTGYNYPSGGYLFGSNYVNALASRGMANPTISWYEAAITNIGLDADLWHGLLGVNIDVFQRDRTGLLATRVGSLPGLVGANLPQENLESDMTRGLELTLSHRNEIENFRYHVSGNLALSRNKTKYRERANANNSYDNWRNNPTDRWNNIWWGLDYLGQFQSRDEIFAQGVIYEYNSQSNTLMLPGDLIYGDWNGDGLINDDDAHPISINNESDPILTYGFNLNGQYKGFDLNLLFQGVGIRWTRYTRFYQDQFLWGRNGLNIYTDRWHRADPFDPNSDEWIPGKYPSVFDGRGDFVATTNQSDPGPASDFWILNAAYLRLKSVEFGYTIPAHISKVAGMQKARLFFNAYNLFTLSEVKLVDVEHPTGNDGFAYPVTKTFNFGINVSF
ncbi:MAG: TonB-dependent receptor [Tannerellaceae bacterium]|jgi:TonB-linked SusC/RagA family outer membrane protein|nr:TonB-dependent receptor [Tannerellaceae bacterium]